MFEWDIAISEVFCSSAYEPGVEPTLGRTVRVKIFDRFEMTIEMRIIGLNNVIGCRKVFDLFESKKFFFPSDNVGHNRKEHRIASGVLIIDRA